MPLRPAMARRQLPKPLWIFLLGLRIVQLILLIVLVAFISDLTDVVDIQGAKYFRWAGFGTIGLTGLFLVTSFLLNACFGDIRFVFMHTRYHHSWYWMAVSVLTELVFTGLFTAMAILSTQRFVFGKASLSYSACVSAFEGRVYATVYTSGSADDFNICEYRQGILILASIIA
jgi:hypothetical protein